MLVHIDILSICSGCFLTICVCLETLGEVWRRSLLSCILLFRTQLGSLAAIGRRRCRPRLNFGTPLVATVTGLRGAEPGQGRGAGRRGRGEPSLGAVATTTLVHVRAIRSIANVAVVALRVAVQLHMIRVQRLRDEAGEVGGGGAPLAWHAPLSQAEPAAAVLTRRGLQRRLGHEKAQGLMGNGVKQEVTFPHQRPLTGQRREVQLSLPPRRGVGEEALHAERVPLLQGRGARPPGAGAVRAARRDLLRFPRRSLVLVVL